MSFIILEKNKSVHKIAKIQQNDVDVYCKEVINLEVLIDLEMRLKHKKFGHLLTLTSIVDN